MADFNKVIMVGRIVSDIELRQIKEELTVTKFNFAVRTYIGGSGADKKEELLYINVEIWGKGEGYVSRYCHTGDELLVEGRLKIDSWEDKEGNKRYKTLVVAQSVTRTKLGRKSLEMSGLGSQNPPYSGKQVRESFGEPPPRPGYSTGSGFDNKNSLDDDSDDIPF